MQLKANVLVCVFPAELRLQPNVGGDVVISLLLFCLLSVPFFHYGAPLLSLSNHAMAVNLCACNEKARISFFVILTLRFLKMYPLTDATSSVMFIREKKKDSLTDATSPVVFA